MNQKFDIIELVKDYRPLEAEAHKIQRFYDDMERLRDEREANGMCSKCGKGLRGGRCQDCK
jgi:hypothetical protein